MQLAASMRGLGLGGLSARRLGLHRRFASGTKESKAAPRCLTRCQLPDYRLARKSREEQRGSTFPFVDTFELDKKGTRISSSDLIALLAPQMGEGRQERFERVAANRTFNVLPIVEGMHDMGNLAAVFRSADALGCGAVHCIRNQTYKQSKRASAGAEKWLDVQLWDDTAECLTAAKEMGYQILATHLSPTAIDISEVDWTRPTAFVLGNEKEGVSETTLAMADQHVVVPMSGFVESYNVSVAAALILYQARMTRLHKLGHHGDLGPEEQRILRALMYLRNKGRTDQIVQQLLNRPPPDWQIHRNGGNWDGKFDELPEPSLRCHYWDGQQCYGESLIFPGKTCRHSEGHRPGASTLNAHKLRQMCERKGLTLPPVLQRGGAKELRLGGPLTGRKGPLAAPGGSGSGSEGDSSSSSSSSSGQQHGADSGPATEQQQQQQQPEQLTTL